MVFVKGQSGNPAGRARTKPITDEIRRQLDAIARGSQKPNLVLVIESLMATAKMRGTSESVAAIKLMLGYLEGAPIQTVEIDVYDAARREAEARGLDPEKVVSILEGLKQRRAG